MNLTKRRLHAAAVLTALAMTIPAISHAGGSTKLVATKKLLLKDTGVSAEYKGKIVVKDPTFTLTNLSPTTTDWSLYLYSSERGDWSNLVPMPTEGWTAKKSGFNYKDGGVVVKLREGKLIFKSTGAISTFELLGQPEMGSVAYRFSEGSDIICGLVPGMDGTVKKDDPEKGIYSAGKSEAPAGCPPFID